MRFLIMAAGPSERFGGTKQLLQVGPEPLLLRLCRQVEERGGEPIVFTNNHMINDACASRGYGVVSGPKRMYQMEAKLLDTYPYWNGPVCFMFGDCIFSKAAMDRVFEGKPFVFFGNLQQHQGEGFCWIFEKKQVLSHLVKVVRDAYKGGYGVGFDMVFSMLDLPPTTTHHTFGQNDERFVWFNDYTCDIDFQDDFINFKEKVIDTGLLDDLPKGVKHETKNMD